jgi:hypothetical protein
MHKVTKQKRSIIIGEQTMETATATNNVLQIKNFKELKKLNKSETKKGFMVVRCAGHPDNSQAWIDGINNDLMEEGIITSPITEAYTIHVCDNRDDLILVYTTAEGLDMGRLPMWRIASCQAGWSITWLEDYIVNDKDDFDEN